MVKVARTDGEITSLYSFIWRVARNVYSDFAKACCEVMIMYYIDGLSTAKIAKSQNTSEGAVCQRLFSARQSKCNYRKTEIDYVAFNLIK